MYRKDSGMTLLLAWSQMKAIWVKQVRRFLRPTRCAEPAQPRCRIVLHITVPLASPWYKHTEVSSRLMRSGSFSGGTRLAAKLNHCHTAKAYRPGGAAGHQNLFLWAGFRPSNRGRIPDLKSGPDSGPLY